MSQGSIARRLIPLVKAHPRLAGLSALAVAGYMAFDSVETGRRYEPFQGGAEFQGQVTAVRDSPGARPRYSAEVTIPSSGGETTVEQVTIGRREASRIHEGDPMAMTQARDGTPRFVRASALRSQGLITILGRTVTGLIVVSMLLGLFGLWLFFFGPSRFAEAPEPAPAPKRSVPTRRTPPPSRPSAGAGERR